VALTLLIYQVEPLLAKSDLKEHNKALATFVELKRNLLLNYCSFLAFYLLLKVDKTKSEDDIKSHPVLFKLTTLKQTLDGLAPLDAKLETALRVKHLAPPIQTEPDEQESVMEEAQDDDDEEGEADEYGSEDISDSGLMTKAERHQVAEEQKQVLAKRLRALDNDSDLESIVKTASKSKKEAKQRKQEELAKKETDELSKKEAKRAQEKQEALAKKQAEDEAAEAEKQERKRERKLAKKEKAKEERVELDRKIGS